VNDQKRKIRARNFFLIPILSLKFFHMTHAEKISPHPSDRDAVKKYYNFVFADLNHRLCDDSSEST
jgi:hypothetical protein